MAGSLLVDFAGTPDEARDFAQANGVNAAARGGYIKGAEFPHLSLPWKTKEDFEAGVAKFVQLGWDGGIWVTAHGNQRRPSWTRSKHLASE